MTQRPDSALPWLLAPMIFLGMTLGCQRESAPTHEANSANAPVSTTVPEDVVIDRLGRVVRIDRPATRIVSLSPATTELLFALGLGPSVVGVTKNCNFPPEAIAIPHVGGGTLQSISSEAIVSAKPDLVLCKWDSHQPLIDSLERLRIRALAIGPQNLDELFEEAKWLGRMTGRETEADDLVTRMQAHRSHLGGVVSRVKQDPPIRVFYEVWDDPLMTAGPDSFIDELLSMAGLENIVTNTAIRYPRISSETVLRGNPELILAPTTHFEKIDIEEIRNRPGWNSVAAIKQQRVHLISGDEVSRCGPRLLDALAEIILAAYPDVREGELQASAASSIHESQAPLQNEAVLR